MFMYQNETSRSPRIRLGIKFASNIVELRRITDRDDPNYIQKGRNMGVFASKNIEKDTYLLSYPGLVRREDNDTNVSDYDVPFRPTVDGDLYAVVPVQWGNESRYINDIRHHSSRVRSPNICLKTCWSRHTGERFTGVFSIRNIRANEQLLIDYGSRYWNLDSRKKHIHIGKSPISLEWAIERGIVSATELETKAPTADTVTRCEQALKAGKKPNKKSERAPKIVTPEQREKVKGFIEVCGGDLSEQRAIDLLRQNNWSVQKAVAMYLDQAATLSFYEHQRNSEEIELKIAKEASLTGVEGTTSEVETAMDCVEIKGGRSEAAGSRLPPDVKVHELRVDPLQQNQTAENPDDTTPPHSNEPSSSTYRR